MSGALDRNTLEAAARWYVQLSAAAPTDADRQAWRHWLGEHQAHAQAWARVEKLQRQLGSVPAEVSLPTLAGVRARRRAVLKTLGILLTAGAAGWSINEVAPAQMWMADYRTRKGQRRTLTLSDGSQLDLNTDTAVDVAYTERLRLIRLHRGEIMIQTAHDASARPFVVQTPQGSVRALGTRFDVRCDAHTAQVSMLQHAVEVRPLHEPSHVLRLESGQRADFDSEHTESPHALPPGTGVWTQGMLTVVEWRLADFIAELSRYRSGVLRCASSIAELRLSGAFRIDNTDIVLENLSASLPIKVRYLTRYWVSVEPA